MVDIQYLQVTIRCILVGSQSPTGQAAQRPAGPILTTSYNEAMLEECTEYTHWLLHDCIEGTPSQTEVAHFWVGEYCVCYHVIVIVFRDTTSSSRQKSTFYKPEIFLQTEK